jgi:hypothetical protein
MSNSTNTFSWSDLDSARLKQAAEALRQALEDFRTRNQRNSLGVLCDDILRTMGHEFSLALSGKVRTPFDVGWAKAFGDQLAFPEITEAYYKYQSAARAGMDAEQFCRSPFYRRYLQPDGTLSDRID